MPARHSSQRKALSLDEATRRAEGLAHGYAAHAPYKLAADPVVLRTIIRGLARNWVKHGLPLCPCKEVTGKREIDRLIVCPCRDHHSEIAQHGSCCCGLYWKED